MDRNQNNLKVVLPKDVVRLISCNLAMVLSVKIVNSSSLPVVKKLRNITFYWWKESAHNRKGNQNETQCFASRKSCKGTRCASAD